MMLKRFSLKVFALTVCLSLCMYYTAFAQVIVDEVSVLSGTVTWTVQVGQEVQEGSNLVSIQTLTGSASACRASQKGIVSAVLVHAGQDVQVGQTVVKISPQH